MTISDKIQIELLYTAMKVARASGKSSQRKKTFKKDLIFCRLVFYRERALASFLPEGTSPISNTNIL